MRTLKPEFPDNNGCQRVTLGLLHERNLSKRDGSHQQSWQHHMVHLLTVCYCPCDLATFSLEPITVAYQLMTIGNGIPIVKWYSHKGRNHTAKSNFKTIFTTIVKWITIVRQKILGKADLLIRKVTGHNQMMARH